MSTGNDTALPENQDQPSTIEAAVAATAAADQGTQPPASDKAPLIHSIEEVEDPDDIVLREAIAQAEAEEAGAGAAPQDDPSSQDPAQAGNPPAAAQDHQQQPPQQSQGQQQRQPAVPMIPKPRFDEIAKRAQDAERAAAYWQGVAHAARLQPQAQQGQQQEQPPQQTPEQRLAEIKAQRKELATKFDAGELSTAQWLEQDEALNDQALAIREELLVSKVQPQAAGPSESTLYLAEKTIELERNHPWVGVADQVATDTEWASIKNIAIERCIAKGIDPTKGDLGRYNLRAEVAQVWTELGPAMLAARAAAHNIAIPGTRPPAQQGQQQQQQQRQQLSPEARARLAKLDVAGSAPPDLAAMNGNVGDPAGGLSEARLEAISEDDFDKLPTATRNKLLGISA